MPKAPRRPGSTASSSRDRQPVATPCRPPSARRSWTYGRTSRTHPAYSHAAGATKTSSAHSTWTSGPIIVMSGLDNQHQALHFLAELPDNAYVYSHPRNTRTALDTTLASAAVANDALPAGAKIAKISLRDITRFRSAVGPHFELWNGSSRHIRASIRNGASVLSPPPLPPCRTPSPNVRSRRFKQPWTRSRPTSINCRPGKRGSSGFSRTRGCTVAPRPRGQLRQVARQQPCSN